MSGIIIRSLCVIPCLYIISLLYPPEVSTQNLLYWEWSVHDRVEKSNFEPVTFQFYNTPLKDALSEFTARTGIVVVYSMGNDILSNPVNTGIFLESPLAALQKILDDTGYHAMMASSGRIILVPRIMLEEDYHGIVGFVHDLTTGEPIPRVNVILKELGIGTMTNENGGFSLDKVPSGEYTIRVSHIGYVPKERQVYVQTGSAVLNRVELESAVLKLGDIYIDDTSSFIHEGGMQVSGTRIDNDRLDRSGGMWIGQILQSRVAGVSFYENGAGLGGGTIQFRGVGSFYNPTDYMRINIDGIPVEGIYWETFITDNLSKVEILRGPQASGRYGSSAMSGVINLYTDTGSEGDVEIKLSAAGGLAKNASDEFNPVWQEYFSSVRGGGDNVTSSLTFRYMSDQGILVNRGSEVAAITAGARAAPIDGVTIRGTLRFNELTSGLPYAHNIRSVSSVSMYNPNLSLQQRRGVGGINIDVELFDWWIQNLTLGSEFYKGRSSYSSRYIYIGEVKGLVDYGQLVDIIEEERHMRPTLHYTTNFALPFGENDIGVLSMGIEVQRTDLEREVGLGDSHMVELLTRNRTQQTVIGKYLSWMFNAARKFNVAVGFRMDEMHAGGTVFYLPVSPSLNVGYRVDVRDSWVAVIRGGAGRGVRLPHYSMIFGHAPFELPNPELKPETMDGWEIGVSNYMFDGDLSVTTTYFAQKTSDTFQPIPDPEEQLIFRWHNVGEIFNQGVEFDALLRIFRWMEVGFIHTWYWNRIIDLQFEEIDEFNQFRVPSYSGSLYLAVRPVRNLVFNIDAYYVGNRYDLDIEAWYRDGLNRPITIYERLFAPSLNIDLTGRFIIFQSHEIFLNVFNLLDDDMRQYGMFFPSGRLIILGARYKI